MEEIKYTLYKVNHDGDMKNKPWVPCTLDHIPPSSDPIIISPYPITDCFLFGDGESTCQQLLKEKLIHDYDFYKLSYEKAKSIFDQFIKQFGKEEIF